MIESQPSDELGTLLNDAATVSRAGDHGAAVAVLSSAATLAPDDLTVHRRLAAAFAVAGDLASARREYQRFITRLALRGSTEAAAIERSYAERLLVPGPIVPVAAAAPARHELTEDQAHALRRVAVAVIAIAAAVSAMIVAGAQIFASGGPL